MWKLRRRFTAVALFAACCLAGCRTATTIAGDRDLYAEAARPPAPPPPPRVIVASWCDEGGAGVLRERLASRPHTAEPPEVVVRGGARYLAHETVGTGAAIAYVAWDSLAGIPGFLLPVPMFFGGEYALHLDLRDRETGMQRSERGLTFAFRGTTYWLWGLMGARRCRTDDFAPLAVPLVEEQARRLALPEDQRAFLARARGLLEEDRRLLTALAAGEDPRAPSTGLEGEAGKSEDPTNALLRSGGTNWGDRSHGSERLRSNSIGAIHFSHRSTLDADGNLQREEWGDGNAKVRWFASRLVTATDGEWDYLVATHPDVLLAVAEYVWEFPSRTWRRTRFASATPALERALAENAAALRRIEERARALGP